MYAESGASSAWARCWRQAYCDSDVGLEIPGLGVFVGPNLTTKKLTWKLDQVQIAAALKTGKRPDKRELAPIMLWRASTNLMEEDVSAIATFLRSLQPVVHKVRNPFGSKDKVTTFVMKVVASESAVDSK